MLVGGLPIDNADLAQSINRLLHPNRPFPTGYCILANAHMGYLARQDAYLKELIARADHVYADGRPVYWAARLLGAQHLQHCRGEDVCNEMITAATKRNLKIGFFGCRDQHAMDELLVQVRQTYPEANIGWTGVPPMMSLDEVGEDPATIESINQSGIAILFVGIGCPKQEYWMARNASGLQCVSIGVGAVFDFMGGQKAVAPKLMQYLGMEWLFRLLSEPKRLCRRYLVESPLFLFQVVANAVKDRLSVNPP